MWKSVTEVVNVSWPAVIAAETLVNVAFDSTKEPACNWVLVSPVSDSELDAFMLLSKVSVVPAVVMLALLLVLAAVN